MVVGVFDFSLVSEEAKDLLGEDDGAELSHSGVDGRRTRFLNRILRPSGGRSVQEIVKDMSGDHAKIS
jgi:hypothetical protein